jgi:FkbM family methyltransferase
MKLKFRDSGAEVRQIFMTLFMMFKKLLMQCAIQFLDRPGGRAILRRLATRYAQFRKGYDFEALYCGAWTYRDNQFYFQGGNKFDMGLIWHLTRSYRSYSEDYWFWFYRPKKGEVIVDVGAGRGEDLPAFLDAVGTAGRAIAIEAHPIAFHELEAFCRLNPRYNLTVLQVALMNEPGSVAITDLEEWVGNEIKQKNDPNAIHVMADTFDNICERELIEDIGFLKMNIEGAERYALLGMDRAIRRCKAICVACHDFRAEAGHGERFRTRAFVENFLIQHGFKIVSRRDDPRDYIRDHVYGLKQ